MKLITKAIENQLAKADYDGNVAICKFFVPWGAATWVVFGRDADDPDILYAACDLGMQCVEYGGVRLSELESITGPMGLKIERDLHFTNAGKPLDFFLGRETLAGV